VIPDSLTPNARPLILGRLARLYANRGAYAPLLF
jgi:hypothetical protein